MLNRQQEPALGREFTDPIESVLHGLVRGPAGEEGERASPVARPGPYEAVVKPRKSTPSPPTSRCTSHGEQAAGDGRRLTINGTTYANGVRAHADSALHLWLGRACAHHRFTAQVGIDDEVRATGSVRFAVYGNGRLFGYSDVKTASAGPSTLTVATSGYAMLELRVTDARNGIAYDHAGWAAAILIC